MGVDTAQLRHEYRDRAGVDGVVVVEFMGGQFQLVEAWGPGRPLQSPDRVRSPARQDRRGSLVAAESRRPPRLLDGHRIRPASRIAPGRESPDSTTWEYRELLGPCTTRIDRADHIPGELFESTEQDEQGQVDEHFGLRDRST